MGLEDTKVQFAHWRAEALKHMKRISGPFTHLQEWSTVDVKGKCQATTCEVILLLAHIPTFQQPAAEGTVLLGWVYIPLFSCTEQNILFSVHLLMQWAAQILTTHPSNYLPTSNWFLPPSLISNQSLIYERAIFLAPRQLPVISVGKEPHQKWSMEETISLYQACLLAFWN